MLLLAAPVAADHLEDGSYRCDGGWCSDGEHHELHCDSAGCMGQTRGFTSITGAPMGDGSWLDEDDWVLGVARGGEAKAYPIRIISGQQGWELVLDSVGGTPLVVTYCPLCASGIVYETTVGGGNFDFRNSGAIWRWDLVMYDKQTETLWSQVSGEALGAIQDGKSVEGPLHGEELTLVPAEMVRWSAWEKAYPDTQAMDIPRDLDGGPLCTCPPISLNAGQLVHGVEWHGATLAFPVGLMREERLAHLREHDVVAVFAGDNVHAYAAAGRTFHLDGDAMVGDDARRYDPLTGRSDGGPDLSKIPGKTTFTHRWELFHEDTIYYEGMGQTGDQPPGRETPWPLAASLVALVITAWMRRSGPSRNA